MSAAVIELQSTAITRNCHRCGQEFRAFHSIRICATCRKPRVRVRPISKRLTLRERQVVDLVSQGTLNKEIAYRLHLREGTIKTYLHAIFQKVGVTNRTELAIWALTLGTPQEAVPQPCAMPTAPA
jgi:DNA-binding NarL/FixJ family response regulator